jgi:hypothetical protein
MDPITYIDAVELAIIQDDLKTFRMLVDDVPINILSEIKFFDPTYSINANIHTFSIFRNAIYIEDYLRRDKKFLVGLVSSEIENLNNIARPEDFDVIDSYVGDDYYFLNNILYTERTNLLTESQHAMINSLNYLFENIAPTTEYLTVFRGVSKHGRFVTEFNFNNPQFISTTLDLEVAKVFATSKCCIVVIEILPGSKILPLIGRTADEAEILLSPFLGTFKYHKEQIIVDANDKEFKYVYMSYGPNNKKRMVPTIEEDVEYYNDVDESYYVSYYDIV